MVLVAGRWHLGDIVAPAVQLLRAETVLAGKFVFQLLIRSRHANDDRKSTIGGVVETYFNGCLSWKPSWQITYRTFADLRAIFWRGTFPFDNLHQNRTLILFVGFENTFRSAGQRCVSHQSRRPASLWHRGLGR